MAEVRQHVVNCLCISSQQGMTQVLSGIKASVWMRSWSPVPYFSCFFFSFFFLKQARVLTQKSTITMTQSFRKNFKASLYLHLTPERESGAIFRVALLIFSWVDRILTGSTEKIAQMRQRRMVGLRNRVKQGPVIACRTLV